jgi:hypothetical protein
MVDAACASSRAVQLTVEESGAAVALTLDPRWLASTDRRWPIVVDPTYVYSGADTECYIANGTAAGTSFCGLDRLNVGFDGTKTSRALLRYGALGDIPKHAVVLDAELTLRLESTTTANAAPVSVHRVTRSFNAASWNQADPGINWTSPGGDFVAGAAATLQAVGGSSGVSHQWPLRKLVQGWIDGSLPQEDEAKRVLLQRQPLVRVPSSVIRAGGLPGGIGTAADEPPPTPSAPAAAGPPRLAADRPKTEHGGNTRLEVFDFERPCVALSRCDLTSTTSRAIHSGRRSRSSSTPTRSLSPSTAGQLLMSPSLRSLLPRLRSAYLSVFAAVVGSRSA